MKAILLPTSLILSLLVSGIIFGFQALRPLLIAQGAYADKCIYDDCSDQILQLNWIFSLCTTINNVSALGIGVFLDYFGPKLTIVMGSVVFSLGCLVTSFASSFQILYLIGFSLLSVAGPTVFMGLLAQTRIFKNNQGMVMAAFVGTFDASTIVFYVFQVLLQYNFFKNLSILFRYYGILPLILSLIVWINWENEETKIVVNEEEGGDYGQTEESRLLFSKDIVEEEDSGIWEQIKSGYFIGITIFLSIYMTRVNFYISTISDQFLYIAGNDTLFKENIPSLLAFFNILLPVGGIVSIPIIGALLDKLTFPILFTLLSISGTVFGILNFLPNVIAQYIAICLFVLLRPFVYSMTGDFCSKMFRLNTFGRIYGLMNFIAGVVNMSQYLLTLIAITIMNGSFWTSNFILLVLTVGTFAFPAYLKNSVRLQ